MSLLLTMLFATVSYTLLEQPFLKLKERLSMNRIEAEREEMAPVKCSYSGVLQ
jgi:peptidoglycan/LPS O-acetylase OafA/YrhL